MANKLYNIKSFFKSYIPKKIKYESIDLKRASLKSKKYIIATKNGLYLFDNDRDYKLLNGRFYGIAKYNDIIYVFERVGDLKGRILKLTFDKKYNFDKKVDVVIDDLSPGCHQIDIFDEYLYITDTYNNRILKYNIYDMSFKEFYPLGKLENGRGSENYAHINSIYKHKEHFYLMCHNETTKTDNESEILRTDNYFNIIEIINTSSVNAHNILIYDDKIYHCDSMNKQLKSENEVVFEGDYFTRGLSYDGELFIVGGSEYAKRSERTKVNGYIYVLNDNLNLLDNFEVPGMVQEIRRIDGIEFSLSNNKRNSL